MPVYEFVCETCGTFEEHRPLDEATQPLSCPACGRPATRVYSAPAVRRLSRASAEAHERNERSVHDPKVVKRPRPDPPAGPSKPGHGHGRPWQLGH